MRFLYPFFIHLLITSCNQATPESVVTDFHKALETGQCEDALPLVIGDAAEYLQGAIDAGCQPYDTRKLSRINCVEMKENMAVCSCFYEFTDYPGMNGMFMNYHTKKVDGDWKIFDIPPDYNK